MRERIAEAFTWSRVVALFGTLLVAIGVTVVVVDSNDDGVPDRAEIRISLGGADDAPAGVPSGPSTLTLDEQGANVLEQAKVGDLGGHDRLDDETPADLDLTPEQEQQVQDALEQNAESNVLPDVTPLAAPFQPGCRTRLVGNYSSRNGVTPRLIVAHYTVSPNRAGFDDVDGITAYFASAASQASSHYVIDADGNCNYIVRETSKAWTQAAGNPWSVAIEHIATGSESDLANRAGYRKAGRVYDAIARRWNIPLQRGAVAASGVPTRPGIVQHADGGLSWGGHRDVNPFEVGKLIAAAKRHRKLSHRLERRKADHKRNHAQRRARCSREQKRASADRRRECRKRRARHEFLHERLHYLRARV